VEETESLVCASRSLDHMNIQAQGTLDVFLAHRLAEVALECLDAGLDTVVRCETLERMDASALQVLVALRRDLAGKGHELWFTDVSANVREYLGIAGLHDIDPAPGQPPLETTASQPPAEPSANECASTEPSANECASTEPGADECASVEPSADECASAEPSADECASTEPSADERAEYECADDEWGEVERAEEGGHRE
jgi:anti-anti-sigma factor